MAVNYRETHDCLGRRHVFAMRLEHIEILFDREYHALDFAIESKIRREQLRSLRSRSRVAPAEVDQIEVERKLLATAPVLERAPNAWAPGR